MVDWDFLIAETGLESVIPDEYARYRRPISGALGVFLAGLPPARQAAILADQAALPPSAAISERLARLARSCPALHKIGQILARDRRLGPELRGHLQGLESLPPSIPPATIRDILAREIGPPGRLGVELDPPALAEASVAVVVPFREGGDAPGRPARRGVFKILKPGIEERLEQELHLLGAVGAYLDERCDEFGLPALDYRETFEQVREKLRQEVRLDLEQEHLVRARSFYSAEPRVLVPELFPHCTPRITAMERVFGVKVTDHRLDALSERRRLAGLVASALVARPVFSAERHALFHADPHAGNLLLTDDGRLALLDWSLAGSLGEAERTAIVQVMLAALTLDSRRIVALLAGLSRRGRCDLPALGSLVRGRVRQLRYGQAPGFAWLLGLLDEAVQVARLGVGPDLMLFRKMLHTLEGVVADIGAGDGRINATLQGAFLGHLATEWPRRWLSPPDSRTFATRLSNADLLQWLVSVPWTPARFWLDQALDAQGAVPG